jgi:hypothetical protein
MRQPFFEQRWVSHGFPRVQTPFFDIVLHTLESVSAAIQMPI